MNTARVANDSATRARILVVDDEVGPRESLRMILAPHCAVESACSAGDGLEALRTQEHPSIGERLVRPLGLSGGVAAAIRHHHERWDRRGYPNGLLGEEIPIGVRVIAVADSYDAMTSARLYPPALNEERALQELGKEPGRAFDPQLVEHFVEIVRGGAALLTKTEGGNNS